MLELIEAEHGKVLIAKLSGTFTHDDLQSFLPEAERLIKKHGKIRVLCHIHDSHGWQPSALWENVKFDLKHFADIERLAVVGHEKWQHGLALFCKPFTQAKVRHFNPNDFEIAVHWLWADLPAEASLTNEQSTSATHGAVQEAVAESLPASDAQAP